MPIKCEKLAISRVSLPPRCFKTQKGPVKMILIIVSYKTDDITVSEVNGNNQHYVIKPYITAQIIVKIHFSSRDLIIP